ncbi:type VII secretion target [Micromonospora sp. NPDC007271]|uniref:type VII secretion target n=1 Tax=Micromonospora sp. NPDC007271 TaxID=3154587 RepID=UPI0033EAFB9E
MSGAGFHVDPDVLQQAAAAQEALAEGATQTARTVEAATAQGNLFGVVGQLAGLDAGYRGWVADEVASLDGLARYLADLADGLRDNAASYTSADTTNAEHLANRYPER